MNFCDEPGYQSRDKRNLVWDCGAEGFGDPNPPLPRAPRCRMQGQASDFGYLNYQYQGGDLAQGSLILPPGYGITIGGPAAPKSIVIWQHYTRQATTNFSTGRTTVHFRVQKSRSSLQPVYGLAFDTFGMIIPSSVGKVRGSWCMQTDSVIRIISLYTHWHELAIQAEVAVVHGSSSNHILLRQDPATFRGVTYLNRTAHAFLRRGDRVTLTCTFNNTLQHVLRIA